MRRSEINAAQRQATALIEAWRFALPSWATWSPEQWAAHPQVAAYCRARQMGWDVTDFGSGDFRCQGLLLFGVRNGRLGMPGEITYAEKLLMIGEGQVAPLHTHHFKTEDIINRGGGVLVLELATATTGGISDAPVTVFSDGQERTLAALEPLHLHPGQSVTLHPGTYHRFYALPGHGPVMAGEVSAVNDDQTDNLFLEPAERFSSVQEDEPTLYPLWNELPAPS
ncbi:D-lyxose/D-mannose family sugar isomerase [Deinococcus sp. KSM4-11]|uniref:D-lyxose/D-mannose family sugar isomerase n=1 Tax=Deinococcus sp. KSM4-11 TaxID=2568654 RepID=UPI0010A588B8|nr:D-lyxose/D-mannose family sugar isomerase [Deinococcus sp. KSM4-11]THF84983.1 D-lyxose/D-mannose family sugar isomerase [Deinococcus sp. KSM4-11]